MFSHVNTREHRLSNSAILVLSSFLWSPETPQQDRQILTSVVTADSITSTLALTRINMSIILTLLSGFVLPRSSS